MGTLKESEKPPPTGFVINKYYMYVGRGCPQHVCFSECNSHGKFEVKGTYQ